MTHLMRRNALVSAFLVTAAIAARGAAQDPTTRPDLIERLSARLAAVEREAARRAEHEQALLVRIGELERHVVDAENASESRATAAASRDSERARLIEDVV